jgi:hypothetical protein
LINSRLLLAAVVDHLASGAPFRLESLTERELITKGCEARRLASVDQLAFAAGGR